MQAILDVSDVELEQLLRGVSDSIQAHRLAAQPLTKEALGADTLPRCTNFAKKEGCKWGVERRFLHAEGAEG